MTSPSRLQLERLADELAALRSDFTALAQERRLAHASMEGGAIGVNQPGTGGLPGVSLGQQYDGTYAPVPVGGPAMPTPTAPQLAAVGNILFVRWNGLWADALVAPMDFARVEVHVGTAPTLTGLDFSTLRLPTIETARGGELAVQGLTPGVDYWVRLTARSLAGKFGPSSVVVGPIQVSRLGVDDIDVGELGGNTIYRGSSAPTGTHKLGDLWLQTPDNIAHRWEGDPADWVPVPDQRVAQAIDDAFAAQQAADQAGIDALAAQTLAGTKTTTYRQVSAPPTTGRVVGDEWIETDEGNRRYTWNGSAWTLDQLGALALSATARQLGAITIYRQASQPASGMLSGDYWLDSDDGNKPYHYNGTSWVLSQDAAINTAITNAATAQATADSKVRVFPQASAPTGLTAADDGDVWIDLDDGNRTYTWGTSVAVERTNLTLNPSFEVDAAGTVTDITAWTSYQAGTVNTVTRSVATTGAVSGTKVGKVVSTSLGTTTGSLIGYQQVLAAVPGDVVRVSGTVFALVAGTNHPVELLVEWLDAIDTLLGSGVHTGTGATGNQVLTYTTAALPANTAKVRFSFRRRGNGAGTALANADLNVDAVIVEKNRPAGAPTSYFDGSSGGEARWTGQAHLSPATTWQIGTAGAYAWQPRYIRTGAIQPDSLVASDVVATGTVSAALLEAILVLATTIVAGNPEGNHARLDPDGLRVMRPGPDGTPIESTRLGGPGSDVLSITNALGVPVIYGDDQGKLTTEAIYTKSLYLGGRLLNTRPEDLPRGIVQRAIFDVGPSQRTTAEVGVLELGAQLEGGRLYEIRTGPLRLIADQGVPFSAVARMRWLQGGGAVLLSSPLFQEMVCHIDNAQVGGFTQLGRTIINTVTPSPSTFRFLLSVAKVVGTGDVYMHGATAYPIEIVIEDKGLWRPQGGVLSTGGGGAGSDPQPRQTYEKAYTCTWTRTVRGSGTVRADTTDAVQGQAPGDSFNGNQGAMLGFQNWAGDISGATINAITLFMYANHFYSDAGGPAWIGYHGYVDPVGVIDGAQNQTTHPFPKVGGGAKDLTAWAGLFLNGTIRGIILGRPPAGQENYGRFAGAGTGNPPVLVINYTK